MCCCGTSICAVCEGCGGICGTCTCQQSLSDAFCGGCTTGNPGCCGPTGATGACCIGTATGSQVDLGCLPLTAPSGDPPLDGLTPSCAATDTPPATSCCPSAPKGGGGGGGSAKMGGGSLPAMPRTTQCANVTKLSNALSRFGTSLATLFGKAETTKTCLEKKTVSAITTPAFLIVILVVGVLVVMLAWHGKES